MTVKACGANSFARSEKVDHKKVSYGIALAADLYQPKNTSRRLAALAIYRYSEPAPGHNESSRVLDSVIKGANLKGRLSCIFRF